MTIRAVWAFIWLTRPVFLLGGALLYALGVAMAGQRGVSTRLERALLGQVMVTAIQLMAHYANEYYDIATDGLNSQRTWFTGGSGILPGGELSRGVARRASFAFAVVSIAAIMAVMTRSPAAGVLGAISMLGAWFYSAPPLVLMSSGWGELSTSLIVALLTPLTGFVLQTGRMDTLVLRVCAPLVMIHLAMLLAFEFPDWDADTATDKRTLVVRLGREPAVYMHTALITVATLLLLTAALDRPAARYVWLMTPLAAWQVLSLARHARHRAVSSLLLTLGAVSLFVLTAVLWLLGFATL